MFKVNLITKCSDSQNLLCELALHDKNFLWVKQLLHLIFNATMGESDSETQFENIKFLLINANP